MGLWGKVRSLFEGNHGRPGNSPDPYSIEWDPVTGMPKGLRGPPGSNQARAYQYRAMEMARQRREALWGSAAGAIQGGLNLLQSYRPGGAAALGSGMFGQLGATYGAHAQSITEPDLLADLRRNEEERARGAADQAAGLGMIMGLAGLAAGGIGGPAAAGAAMGSGGAAGLGAGAMGGMMGGGPAAGGLTGAMAGAQAGFGGGGGGGGLQARMGSGGVPGPGPAGGDGGGPSQARRSQSGPGPGGPGAAPSPAGGPMGAGPGGGGGFGGNGDFTQTALAALGAASGVGDVVAMEAADELSMNGTRHMLVGSRARLLEAIYG